MIKKTLSLAIALAWLAFSVFLGQNMFQAFHDSQHEARFNLFFNHFAFDITVIISIAVFNFFWNNLQIYDAYYSLIPIIRLILLQNFTTLTVEGFNLKNHLLLVFIGIWGIRLFAHIFNKWRGFPDQDKRITAIEFKRYSGAKRIFFWVWQNPFVGVLNALLISFLTLPVTYFLTRNESKVISGKEFVLSDIVGFSLIFFGLAVQAIADMESVEWRNYGTANKVCDKGLRRYLRYPQYYGELVFWFGIWVVCQTPFSDIIVTNFVYWPIGWVLLSLWLLVMSTIMDNAVLSRKDGWNQYRRNVRFGLIPFFRF